MRLPDEVFVLIFTILKESVVGRWPWTFSAFDVRTIASLEWMPILQVCSRWRCIALATPALWNRIAFDARHRGITRSRGDYPSLFIARAAAVPLEVYISTLAGATFEASEVFTQLARTRHLYISGDQFTHDELELLKKPAPQLQTLVLTEALHPLAALFSEGHIPSLRSLGLCVDLLQFGVSCQNLRQLHLELLQFRTPEDYQKFFTLLRQATRLEDLKFSNTRFFDGVHPQMTGPVYLPTLKRLAFIFTHDIDRMLQGFRLPDGVCLSNQPPYHHPCIFPSGDRSHLGDLEHLKRMTLAFQESDGGFCRMYAVGNTSAFQTVIDNPELEGNTLHSATDHIEELWFEGALQSFVQARQLRAIFRELPLLQAVVLTMDDDASLLRCLEVLVAPADSDFANLDSACHCALLRDITIRDPSHGSFAFLVDVLTSRKDAGHPISRVQIDLNVGLGGQPDRDGRFRWWKEVGRELLQVLVPEVTLVETISLPRMRTVPVCHWRSDEAWDSDWPTWGGLHDPPTWSIRVFD